MKKLLSLIVLFFVAFYSNAQFTYKIKADSVKITNDSCDAELILENHTKDTLGFLYNRGKGRTEFKRILHYVNDSTYAVGGDTLRIHKSALSSVALSAITAGTSSNTINSGSYAQEWQWNSLAGGTGMKLSSSSTAAASGTQKLFESALSGANASSSQTTYTGYFTNAHTGTSSTNVGIYSKASGGTTNLAGYFMNDGGNGILRIEQQNSSGIAGINFIGGSNNWGVGHSYSTGTFQFNNSPSFSGNSVLQLFAANRSRFGGGSDDGTNTLQVQGPAKIYGHARVDSNLYVYTNLPGKQAMIGSVAGADYVGLWLGQTSPSYSNASILNYGGTTAFLSPGTFALLTSGGSEYYVRVAGGLQMVVGANAGYSSSYAFDVTGVGYPAGSILRVRPDATNAPATNLTLESIITGGHNGEAGSGISILARGTNGSAARSNMGRLDWLYTTVTSGSEDADFVINNIQGGTVAEKFRVTSKGKPVFQATNTASGTTGNQTINKATGTVNIAASGTSVTVTNNLVTSSSIVFAVIRTNDATAQVKNVVPGSGTFTITLSAAATSETSVGFMVVN